MWGGGEVRDGSRKRGNVEMGKLCEGKWIATKEEKARGKKWGTNAGKWSGKEAGEK
jgi:hypothetical protein